MQVISENGPPLLSPQVAQTCSLFSAPDGRVYRPRDCERLVLYLKDINLPRPDKYDTCMLIAFLQQLQTFGGFYDENLEFLRLERVQVTQSRGIGVCAPSHKGILIIDILEWFPRYYRHIGNARGSMTMRTGYYHNLSALAPYRTLAATG